MYDLISYAMDFASFFIKKSRNTPKIKNIILFGSVSRHEASKGSDVDLFVDVVMDEDEIDKEAKKITKEFYESVLFKSYWELFGIKNGFKLTVGKLHEWDELQNSIISNGITLYGKFNALPRGKNMALFFFENISPNSKRVMINKRMFGYMHSGKRYEGMVEKYRGERLGKGGIMVPTEHANEFIKAFRKLKVNFKIKKIIDYSS